jgi:hypothetical protein
MGVAFTSALGIEARRIMGLKAGGAGEPPWTPAGIGMYGWGELWTPSCGGGMKEGGGSMLGGGWDENEAWGGIMLCTGSDSCERVDGWCGLRKCPGG